MINDEIKIKKSSVLINVIKSWWVVNENYSIDIRIIQWKIEGVEISKYGLDWYYKMNEVKYISFSYDWWWD